VSGKDIQAMSRNDYRRCVHTFPRWTTTNKCMPSTRIIVPSRDARAVLAVAMLWIRCKPNALVELVEEGALDDFSVKVTRYRPNVLTSCSLLLYTSLAILHRPLPVPPDGYSDCGLPLDGPHPSRVDLTSINSKRWNGE
jgi:hypothetical protein